MHFTWWYWWYSSYRGGQAQIRGNMPIPSDGTTFTHNMKEDGNAVRTNGECPRWSLRTRRRQRTYLVVKYYWNEACPGCSKDMKKLSLLLLANNLLLKKLLRRLWACSNVRNMLFYDHFIIMSTDGTCQLMDAVHNPIPFWATSHRDLGCPRVTLPILDFRIPDHTSRH
jgi:hypothetical protein